MPSMPADDRRPQQPPGHGQHDFGTTVMKFSVAQVADRVTAPTLVTAYAGDRLVIPPSGQGTEVYQLLRSDKQGTGIRRHPRAAR